MSEPETGSLEAGVPTCYRHPGRETYIRCQRCDRPICPDCMRDAAVGFQCKNCVVEGHKNTRSGNTAYGGQRSANPHLTTIVVIAINVAVFAVIRATGAATSSLVDRLALSPQGVCVTGPNYYPDVHHAATCHQDPSATWLGGVADGSWWQLLTSAFTHVEILHIAFNMFMLWQLGPMVETVIGRARYLAMYVIAGLSGSALVFAASDPMTQTLGASGAIFGLAGALLVFAYKVRGNVQGVVSWLGIMFVYTFIGPGNISWQGHVGGFIGGLVCAAVIAYAPRKHRTAYQVAAMTVFVVLLGIAIALRAAALS